MKIADVTAKFSSVIGSKQTFIIILIASIFLAIAIYTYKRFVSERINKDYVANSEFNDASSKKSADIYFFYTTWCPHCKTAKPIWASFKKEMADKKVNGVKLNFFEVDCDKDTATSDKFNVKGFPTIKLMYGNQIIEYDAKPSKETLLEFVNSALA
jgi:thiol-disulfide isomerase/thioredoxin